jgi:glycosyltransferase involved in cell wall biosynthesis
MPDILLTVAVPTYNRLPYLMDLLPTIIAQCKPHPEVEILVIDNDSTDGSWGYLCDLKRSTGIVAEMNLSNVGGDENFVRCVELARGTYIWLFGDDEVLLPGGVDKILDTLYRHPVSLVVIGHTKRIPAGIGSKFFETYKDFVNYMDPKYILEHSLITCNIFRKKIFNTNIARKCRWTNYGHIWAIVHTLRKDGTTYFLDYPVYQIRECGAPFEEPVPTHLVFKHIVFLSGMSIHYPKMIPYLLRYVLGFIFYKIFR